jgi:nucleoside phosphorylase
MPGRTAFVCAMPMELTPLKKKLSLVKAEMGPLDVYQGILGRNEVVAVVTGMGTKLAAAVLESLLEQLEVARIVVVGITGALESETPIGTIVYPEVVVDSATGLEYRPDQIAPAKPTGKMWTTDVLVTDLDVIARLRSDGVVALDMETAALAQIAERHRIPWSVFRAISDRASDGSLDEEVFQMSNQDGTFNAKAVASYFVKHPGRIPAMARLAKGAKLATERAASAAIEAVGRLERTGMTKAE